MFGIDLHTPLSPDQLNTALDSIAKKIVKRRMETPAVMFLEMHKPLSFIASQSILVAVPLLGPLLGPRKMVDLSKILMDRANIELLICRIEEEAAARNTGAPEGEG